MVDYAGWEMPVEYSGISDEHMAVRSRAGLFDVSHMGEIEVAGADALAALQWLCSNDASRLDVGQAQYSALTTPQGTVVDDVIVYRLGPDHFLLVVNAGSIVKDYEWIAAGVATRGGDVAVVNASSRYALLALQGPAAARVLQSQATIDLEDVRYFRFAPGEVAGVRATVSRTGYTGEDGFEIFVPPAYAERVWDALLDAGRDADVRPCGLGARDTLRLEASLRLCGTDMDETSTLLEAGLGWIVGWKKDDFQGAEPLRRQKAEGVRRRLVGFRMTDRAIARHGYRVVRGAETIGTVTSGTFTPFLRQAVGLAWVPSELAVEGQQLDIEIRGRVARAEVVREPFYKRA